MGENENRTFEDAAAETEQMFNTRQEPELPTEQPAEPVQEQPIPSEQPSEPVQGQPAVNDAAVQSAMLSEVMAENERLRQTNEQLQKTITQQSDIQEAATEERVMPQLDISALAFDDEETVAKKQAQYALDMAEYVKGDILRELEPFVNRAKDGIRKDEKERIITMLEAMPEMQDIRSVAPQLDRIIENNKSLFSDDVAADDKYIAAYAIAKGANMMNNPPHDPTADELMEYYNNNSEFRDKIEAKRLNDIKNSQGQQVPPMGASSGAANAALNIQEKPQSWDDASERTRRLFGIE